MASHKPSTYVPHSPSPASASHSPPHSSLYARRKLFAIKHDEAQPLTRRDIQYDLLHAIFSNPLRAFTDPHAPAPAPSLAAPAPQKVSFRDLYVRALLQSPRCSRALREKMQDSPEFATDFAKIALLANVGRVNTTMTFLPEMRTSLRTYHPVPSLQKTDGNLQDAPRIKNLLKACQLPHETDNVPGSPSELRVLAGRGIVPTSNVVNVLFCLSNNFTNVAHEHFGRLDIDFLDLFLPIHVSSASRARAFLWLVHHYHEGSGLARSSTAPSTASTASTASTPAPTSPSGDATSGTPNPFADAHARAHPGMVPALVDLPLPEFEAENVDPEDEITQGARMSRYRLDFLANPNAGAGAGAGRGGSVAGSAKGAGEGGEEKKSAKGRVRDRAKEKERAQERARAKEAEAEVGAEAADVEMDVGVDVDSPGMQDSPASAPPKGKKRAHSAIEPADGDDHDSIAVTAPDNDDSASSSACRLSSSLPHPAHSDGPTGCRPPATREPPAQRRQLSQDIIQDRASPAILPPAPPPFPAPASAPAPAPTPPAPPPAPASAPVPKPRAPRRRAPRTRAPRLSAAARAAAAAANVAASASASTSANGNGNATAAASARAPARSRARGPALSRVPAATPRVLSPLPPTTTMTRGVAMHVCPQRTMLQHAWHVISTVDPLADSDEEGVDEGSRLEYSTRLEVVQGIRAHAHMLAVARRQQAPHYPAPDAALALALASASTPGPASAPGLVALLPPLDNDPRTGPHPRLSLQLVRSSHVLSLSPSSSRRIRASNSCLLGCGYGYGYGYGYGPPTVDSHSTAQHGTAQLASRTPPQSHRPPSSHPPSRRPQPPSPSSPTRERSLVHSEPAPRLYTTTPYPSPPLSSLFHPPTQSHIHAYINT
ncbi:hypothetical protein HETIRDRAFT_457033 [Heterobasidion irregulare TC 32-1]|uniref:Ino eighty subunit 1 n=1 Tax=Heterobasidion irregulare (strain TC 32-1) TaxID=747525 RepID=W4KQX7_HETIT|nr:uncharacterized protein HETIRDRAFT_457033 [Heterobasidion irregulare TC 32-1]ETW87466.1 hypothetical protein HETIRDRAFT_457033 [Heterobasidion irregulare TC 32-1]